MRVVDVNVIVDKHCPSPVLVRVCEEGKVEFVEVLLKYGADVNIKFVREKHAMCMQNVFLTVRLTPEQMHTHNPLPVVWWTKCLCWLPLATDTLSYWCNMEPM